MARTGAVGCGLVLWGLPRSGLVRSAAVASVASVVAGMGSARFGSGLRAGMESCGSLWRGMAWNFEVWRVLVRCRRQSSGCPRCGSDRYRFGTPIQGLVRAERPVRKGKLWSGEIRSGGQC